jgi:hypothetical protein
MLIFKREPSIIKGDQWVHVSNLDETNIMRISVLPDNGNIWANV